MVNGYVQIVRFEEALWMFRRMGENGMIPRKYAVTGVLSIFSVIGDFDNGRIVHGFVTKIGYGSKKDVTSWNIMITGYGMHGYGDEALDIFFSYVSSPIGKLMEAYDLMLTMPFKADPVGWRALLAACCIHKDTDLAEIAASKVIEIKPGHCGNYVLMPNVYGVSLCSWPGCPPNTADKFAKLQLANIWATPFGIPLHSLFEAKGIAELKQEGPVMEQMQKVTPQDSSLGDGLGEDYGMLGQAGSGKLRVSAGQSKLAAKVRIKVMSTHLQLKNIGTSLGDKSTYLVDTSANLSRGLGSQNSPDLQSKRDRHQPESVLHDPSNIAPELNHWICSYSENQSIKPIHNQGSIPCGEQIRPGRSSADVAGSNSAKWAYSEGSDKLRPATEYSSKEHFPGRKSIRTDNSTGDLGDLFITGEILDVSIRANEIIKENVNQRRTGNTKEAMAIVPDLITKSLFSLTATREVATETS
ncbi:hypothetical protein KIW84_062443 [Lathyrus oleraceus]|uniref:Pentatricopeptide repeat-containing protein n=1 Tax=Pisum sativum TaxID=3888 RepID=A0A9D4W6X6_PEA|nr:hypothetical protein KIW84_062443 [Pisum sativum]